jgi:uncharacterized protein (TIGR02145 family)
MRIVSLVLYAVVLSALTLSSCIKKEGCTNPDAVNYDDDAKEDDGSCIFPIPSHSYLNPNLTYSSVTDIEGNTYATIVIGNQEWMAENLRTSKYCNGDPIPNVAEASQWGSLTSGAWAHYDNDSEYDAPYGKLYNWYAVDDSRNICPCGWQMPTEFAWSDLAQHLGGLSVAGGKMKSTGTLYWQNPNTDATNESGFSSLPGGFRFYSSGGFSNVGTDSYLWSSSNWSDNEGIARVMSYGFGNLSGGQAVYGNYNKRYGFSVRCFRFI